ncbi:hypothetical protein, partial [Sphingomonas sp. 37zxx]|uniref:hypothetical protein n=1 Tax=Sphingomonas sp. 37zxx TaxID=1550073 RepID=UPI001E533CB6
AKPFFSSLLDSRCAVRYSADTAWRINLSQRSAIPILLHPPLDLPQSIAASASDRENMPASPPSDAAAFPLPATVVPIA